MTQMDFRQQTGTFIPVRQRRLAQSHQNTGRWLQIVLDFTVVLGLLYFHTFQKVGAFEADYRVLAAATFFVMGFNYKLLGVYNFSGNVFSRLITIGKAWLLTLLTLVLIGFITKTSSQYSREVILTWAVTAYIGQWIVYSMFLLVLARQQSEPVPALMIGASVLGRHLVNQVNNNPWMHEQIIGVVDDSEQLSEIWDAEDAPLLGNLNNIQQLLLKHHIKRVYIALPLDQADMIQPLFLSLVEKNIDVVWAPDIFSINLMNHSIKEIAGVPLICLSETPLIGSSAFAKRTMDISLSLLALIFILPLMAVIALFIKFTSPGPVLFKQKRHGWDGKLITIFKFRSMKVHEEEEGKVTQACKHDNRMTPIGNFIRKTSLDELPQLFNILKGDMSLVGPRPHAIAHNELYQQQILSYMTRHRVKPGLTGLAQVNGYRGETSELEQMEGRIKYDLAYINDWSLWLDVQIMFRTVFVLFGKNVY